MNSQEQLDAIILQREKYIEQDHSNGRYGSGSDFDRASELFDLDDIHLPTRAYLRHIDWSDPDQVLRELRRAFAGGFATGEQSVATTVMLWLMERDDSETMQDLRLIADPEKDPGPGYLWHRFSHALEIAQLILTLPAPGAAEEALFREIPPQSRI